MTKAKKLLKHYFPSAIWWFLVVVKSKCIKKCKSIYNCWLIKLAPRKHIKALEIVRSRDKVKVAFFLTHESVWKYDVLYNLMLAHPRFEPALFVCPVVNFGRENMLDEMEKTYQSFKNKGYFVTKTYSYTKKEYLNIKKYFQPDLVFYTNPYKGVQDYRYYIKQFANTLTCYVPYAIMTTKYELFYNTDFHNLVWKIFSETSLHQQIAMDRQLNKGINNVVTGYPGFDPILLCKNPDYSVWKNKNKNLKRIIWAPHHSMNELNQVSNFLEYYDVFLELASIYSNRIQIAFKPHPLLRVKLEQDPKWGVEKTSAYYSTWDLLGNGQLENGDYIDLFLSSDALIHDCGSFMAEYLITGKPSLFMIRKESVMEQWSTFGSEAINVHYQSRNKQQLIDFIENIVLQEQDDMKKIRDKFVAETLLNEDKVNASHKIMQFLEKELLSS
jgi:CDP-glycerol glycerophosphotransferase (TagB/SpsB family)